MKTLSLLTLALLVTIGPSFGSDESIEALKQKVEALEKEIEILKAKIGTPPKKIDVQSSDSSKEGPLFVTVMKGGGMIINGKKIVSIELSRLLEKVTDAYPDQAVVIRGEESASYKDILVALESIKKAGVWNIAFAAIQTETEQDSAQ